MLTHHSSHRENSNAPAFRKKRPPVLVHCGTARMAPPGGGTSLTERGKTGNDYIRDCYPDFPTITLTFCTGLYIGSIGIIDPVGATPWYVYVAQTMSSPIVLALGHISAGGGFPVYGWPNEVGQIYTSTAGLLNLLCIINALYLAHLRTTETAGG
jgi:hypothetical protein